MPRRIPIDGAVAAPPLRVTSIPGRAPWYKWTPPLLLLMSLVGNGLQYIDRSRLDERIRFAQFNKESWSAFTRLQSEVEASTIIANGQIEGLAAINCTIESAYERVAAIDSLWFLQIDVAVDMFESQLRGFELAAGCDLDARPAGVRLLNSLPMPKDVDADFLLQIDEFCRTAYSLNDESGRRSVGWALITLDCMSRSRMLADRLAAHRDQQLSRIRSAGIAASHPPA